eukprot:372882_1
MADLAEDEKLNPTVKVRSMRYTSALKTAQRQILMNALDNHELTDTTFIIGEQQTQYQVNRVFLALISDVFKAMLFGQMKESKPNSEVIIEDMEPSTFECIVKFAYSNDPRVTTRNVISLMNACDKYQISTLLDFCHEFIETEVQCVQRMQTILDDKYLLEMDLKMMRWFLQINHMECTEDKVWEFVIKWAKHQSKTYKNKDGDKSTEYSLYLVKSVRDLVRFGTMDGMYFTKYVQSQNVLSDKELISILSFFQQPESGCGAFSTKPRHTIIQLLPYKLKMSSKHQYCSCSSTCYKWVNTYEALITEELSQICGTKNNNSGFSSYGNYGNYIDACFDQAMTITKIQIGPPRGDMYHANSHRDQKWGSEDLKGATLKILRDDVNAKKTWINVYHVDEDLDCIKTITFKEPIVTSHLRWYRNRDRNNQGTLSIALGCFKIFGFKTVNTQKQ